MKRTQPPLRVVPATELENKTGEVIRRVYEKAETQIIERAGLPVAVIISVDEYVAMHPEKAQQLPRVEISARRQRAHKELLRFLDENRQSGEQFADEEVMADALKAIEEVRRSRRKK